MRCAVDGCSEPGGVLIGGRLLCATHAASYRCSVDGCDCWADAAIAGRMLCRHHLVEHRQSGRRSVP